MLRRCVALGTDRLWLQHTHGSSSECVDPPTLCTLRDREAGRQVPALLPAADPSSRRVHPMGVATVTVFSCSFFFWDWPETLCSVQLMSAAQARLETCSSGGDRLIGIEEQRRRHGALQQRRSSGAGAAEEARRWCQGWLEKHKGSSLEKVTYAYYLLHCLRYCHLRLKVYVIYI